MRTEFMKKNNDLSLTEREMDYMVRDHSDVRWTKLNRPNQDDKGHTVTANFSRGVPYNLCAVCIAQRGRMYKGQEQQFEARTDGKTNTLTSVEKDNLVQKIPLCTTEDGKSQTIKAQYSKSSMANFLIDRNKRSLHGASGVAERIPSYGIPNKSRPVEATYSCHAGTGEGSLSSRLFSDNPSKQQVDLVSEEISLENTSNYSVNNTGYSINYDDDGKPISAYKDGKQIKIYEIVDGIITVKDRKYPIKLNDGFYIIRKLSVDECKRLQTIPDWFQFPVSNSRAYQQIGNGWTCDIISWLIQCCMNEPEKEGQISLKRLKMYAN